MGHHVSDARIEKRERTWHAPHALRERSAGIKKPKRIPKVWAQRLCDLCQGIPAHTLDLDNGYRHHKRLRALETEDLKGKCRLCQMMWESLELGFAKTQLEDLLPEQWTVMIFAVSGPSWVWRGYEAIEVRCGNFEVGFTESSQRHTRIEDGPAYPLVSRLYLHSMKGVLLSTNSALEDESKVSFDQVRRWERLCQAHHGHGDAVESMAPLPTRVIDVSGYIPRVVPIQEGGPRSGQYTALSYCWGKSNTYQLNSGNMYSLTQAGIDQDQCSQTVKDAIRVTREIGLQYLWVDALCIIQGSDSTAVNDFRREAASMGDVYRHAFLTIVAADSSDADQGFLRSRMLSTNFKGCSYFRDTDVAESLAQTENAWSRRGWTLQEIAMTKRAIVYKNKMKYWYCAHSLLGEDGKPASIQGISGVTEFLEREWYDFVGDYSKRRLTKGMDRLPALSALARLYGNRHDDGRNETFIRKRAPQYYAGIWKRLLRRGLCWTIDVTQDDTETISVTKRYPTWSWASVDDPVRFPRYIKAQQFHELPHMAASFHVHSDNIDPFSYTGRITLRLQGILVGNSYIQVTREGRRRIRWEEGEDGRAKYKEEDWGAVYQFTMAIGQKQTFVSYAKIVEDLLDFLRALEDELLGPNMTITIGTGYLDHKMPEEDETELQKSICLLILYEEEGLMLKPTGRQSQEFKRVRAFHSAEEHSSDDCWRRSLRTAWSPVAIEII